MALLVTAGCEDPAFGIGAQIRPGGHVDVSPAASGRLGGLDVTVSG